MSSYKNQGDKDTRSGFGEGLTELGRKNKDVVALCADLTGSLKMDAFQKAHKGLVRLQPLDPMPPCWQKHLPIPVKYPDLLRQLV